jgi:cytochrome c6
MSPERRSVYTRRRFGAGPYPPPKVSPAERGNRMKTRFALVLALCLSASAQADDVADVWKAKCKSCHGDDGKAKTKVGEREKIDDMSLPEWQKRHSDEKIRQAISEGVSGSKMKGYKDKLSTEEIDALVKYVRAFQAK